jgi:hypothetical protein
LICNIKSYEEHADTVLLQLGFTFLKMYSAEACCPAEGVIIFLPLLMLSCCIGYSDSVLTLYILISNVLEASFQLMQWLHRFLVLG